MTKKAEAGARKKDNQGDQNMPNVADRYLRSKQLLCLLNSSRAYKRVGLFRRGTISMYALSRILRLPRQTGAHNLHIGCECNVIAIRATPNMDLFKEYSPSS